MKLFSSGLLLASAIGVFFCSGTASGQQRLTLTPEYYGSIDTSNAATLRATISPPPGLNIPQWLMPENVAGAALIPAIPTGPALALRTGKSGTTAAAKPLEACST